MDLSFGYEKATVNHKPCSLIPLVPHYQLQHPLPWDQLFGHQASLDVEIGFGLGEFLVHLAQKHPHRHFVGIEQDWQRIDKTLRKITAFKNVRILKIDAWAAFERLFSPRSIHRIYCLFPCPWPKKAHIKHRLFSHDFFKLLNSRLKNRGQLKIVTDFHPFFRWMQEELKRTGFKVHTKTVRPRYQTKFERKWLEKGQKNFFELEMSKHKHIDVPLKESVPLKSYSIKNFNPKRFFLSDQKGEPVIIFKDVIVDKAQNKAMVHTVVVEEHLTQHFWVAITKHKGIWHIRKAEGQGFFPTPGTAKTLELVYEAARRTSRPTMS